MPERPTKKKYVTFSTSDRFQKARRYIYTHTHMYVYFRETNQVTKPGEPQPPKAASIRWRCLAVRHRPALQTAGGNGLFNTERKLGVFLLFNVLAAQKPYFCTVIIQHILTLILQWRRVMILNQRAQFQEFAELWISQLF